MTSNAPRGGFVQVVGTPQFDDVPDLSLTYRTSVLTALLDDDHTTYEMQFDSVRAVRVTSWDCFSNPGLLPPRGVYEWADSPWIEELRAVTRQLGDGHSLKGSRHIIIACYDDVLEVIASEASLVSSRPNTSATS